MLGPCPAVPVTLLIETPVMLAELSAVQRNVTGLRNRSEGVSKPLQFRRRGPPPVLQYPVIFWTEVRFANGRSWPEQAIS